MSDVNQAHSPWTNLGEILRDVSRNPSAAFNAAFLRVCEIHDALMALAKKPGTPTDDRILHARRFNPHGYTEIFPNDPRQWRDQNYEDYKAYRKQLDDWIAAEAPGAAAELSLFGEHLDLLVLHHQLGKELISRQKLMDKVFGSYTRLRKAADRLPELAGWNRRLTNAVNETVVHYEKATRSYRKERRRLRRYGLIAFLLVLGAILILGLLQWQGIAKTQEELRAEIQQGITATRENSERALAETENLSEQLTALGDRVDEIEHDQIASIQNGLTELQGKLQQETSRLDNKMTDLANAIQEPKQQLAILDQRVQRLEGTMGKPVQGNPEVPASVLARLTAMEARQQQSDARQKILEEGLPSSEDTEAIRQDVNRALAEIGRLANQVAALRQVDSVQQNQKLTALDQRIQKLEGTVGKLFGGPSLPVPPPPREKPTGPLSPPPEPMPTSILDRLQAMEAKQGLLEETLRSSEEGDKEIERSAGELRDALRGLNNAR
uniref:Uncharacterized protein n=1 Tax=Candidatus Kentrum sp. MB TaxID=2138164 RepID=A0A450XQX2_9GAMM|nr:MAG: hypothetical protein BECKMB1821G_GA0114241_10902 [Candidatus Kentron sp. MB]